jgi:vitamin K-dependent gamma-carboxylase
MRDALERPVDAAGPAAFRILFGLLMAAGLIRFLASGWVETFFAARSFHFKYAGFAWVEVLPLGAMYALVVALVVCALGIALGLFYRVAAIGFFVGFSYLQLIDVTNYLNHYYLVALLALLCAILPLHRTWSLDARRRPALASATLPSWVLWLLRFQVGVVYFYAGLAKLNSDWLLHAQPINLWFTARTDTPLIGPWLDEAWLHHAASWAAFLYDTTIVLWLSWRRSRPWAYGAVLGFHAMTHLFFPIGMFPFIMTMAALIFFSPSWPRRLLARLGAATAAMPATTGSTAGRRLGRPALALAAAFVAFQVLVPLRHYLYPGDVAWNEQGMRWSWKVMLREKQGSVTFHVRVPSIGVEVQVPPRRYLDRRQEREMAGQPDLILQLAHRIAADFRRRGYPDVEVRAEALVSLNGRAPRLMIDPERDLAQVSDGLAVADWILPGPAEPPIRLSPVAMARGRRQ